MLEVKRQELEIIEENKKHPAENKQGELSKEIFSTLEDYALKGVEDEYIPDKKRPKSYDIVDI